MAKSRGSSHGPSCRCFLVNGRENRALHHQDSEISVARCSEDQESTVKAEAKTENSWLRQQCPSTAMPQASYRHDAQKSTSRCCLIRGQPGNSGARIESKWPGTKRSGTSMRSSTENQCCCLKPRRRMPVCEEQDSSDDERGGTCTCDSYVCCTEPFCSQSNSIHRQHLVTNFLFLVLIALYAYFLYVCGTGHH